MAIGTPLLQKQQETFLARIANQTSPLLLVKLDLLGLLSRCSPQDRDQAIALAHSHYNGHGLSILQWQEQQFDETPYRSRWEYCRRLQREVPSVDIRRALKESAPDVLAAFAADDGCGVRSEAFETLIESVRDFVVKCATQEFHARGEEAIREIVWRVNFRLYRSLWSGKYEIADAFFGYVRETTRQESLCYFKEQKRRESIGVIYVDESGFDAIQGNQVDPFSNRAINSEAVQSILQGMGDVERILLWSILAEKNSVKEVAVRLGWSVDMVRRKLAAAKTLFQLRWDSKFGI